MDEQDTRQIRFCKLIEDFLAERLESKLKPLVAEEAKAEGEKIEKVLTQKKEVLDKFKLRNWVEDAARRVAQLTMVTHTIKAVNPNAKGTNFYCPIEKLPILQEVGSHVLSCGNVPLDVVGNAAALDVYAFLRLEFEGKTILRWLDEGDTDLLAVMGGDDTAKSWADAFAGIRVLKGPMASHKLAKQIYWLVGDDPCDDGQYHLLSPLYASSLAHTVYSIVQGNLFGDAAKEARDAKRKGQYSDQVLHEYFGLAVQKLGGTKPQNVSQLNSERGGRNYLLDSRPPHWPQRETRPLKGTASLFERFGKQMVCVNLVAKLKEFLESFPPNNVHTRNKRDELIDRIVGEFILYVDRLLKLEPGWTSNPECQIPYIEMLLIDPGRVDSDPEFAAIRDKSCWHDDIAKCFGQWLNGQLSKKLPMGDAEVLFWSDEFEELVNYPPRLLNFERKKSREDGHD
ncbi:type I-F CRISPR-associated protein Csy1 [Solidesulfovibrio magneticus]|uniref:Type I-F CRISPR-associated protein Csy1 n=1 Tax=Solidesulfovibrio magneticus (strain ATCC 700980 / DSM 13731 / RS-1) TaxID=573370 RepID=C4XPX3_SOLM1|nr:type I-F CRISPR-associated protein Csy1 [Solidesulfovibrio magneticus]BAH77673.1 hypothetical protein DMR_41820 [Solidesulfovibrio magneticus RS-1]